MSRPAKAIAYDGARGRTWRIKYRDATGKQVMETIGAERDGVTRKDAEKMLRERLVKVEQKGWRRPAPLTFAVYAETWFAGGFSSPTRSGEWLRRSPMSRRVPCS
jgi:hypothetical protein